MKSLLILLCITSSFSAFTQRENPKKDIRDAFADTICTKENFKRNEELHCPWYATMKTCIKHCKEDAKAVVDEKIPEILDELGPLGDLFGQTPKE